MDKIYIVGGGASGMMAAIQAKTKDNEIILLEKNDRVGKKMRKKLKHPMVLWNTAICWSVMPKGVMY